MKRLYLPIILFLFLVLEGVALDLLPASLLNSHTLIVPHWVFVFLLFVTVFYDQEDTYYAILYGIIFGLLIDVVYTSVLGIYMFSYTFIIYIIHELKRLIHANFYAVTILGIVGISGIDLSIYIIYKMVGLASMPWNDYFMFRLLPTMLANLIFLMILYPIIRKRLEKWGTEQLSS